MNLIKRTAYKLVYKDLSKIDMFCGKYDAQNGDIHYMYGIEIIMEYIAFKIGENFGNKFNEMFIDNLIISERKSSKLKQEKTNERER